MIRESVAALREQAQEVLNHCDLEQIALVNADSRSQVGSPPTTLDVTAEVGAKAERASSDLIRVWVRYEVVATDDETAGRQAWRIEAEWIADFRGTEMPQFSRRALNAFALVMGPPTIHPYARQHIQDITSQGLYPAFTMELLHPVTSLPLDEELELSDDYDPDAARAASNETRARA